MPGPTSPSGMIGSPAARAGAAAASSTANESRSGRSGAMDRLSVARGVGLSVLAPAQVLDDAVRVADRLAAQHEQRHALLPRQRADLGPVAPAPRHPDDV